MGTGESAVAARSNGRSQRVHSLMAQSISDTRSSTEPALDPIRARRESERVADPIRVRCSRKPDAENRFAFLHPSFPMRICCACSMRGTSFKTNTRYSALQTECSRVLWHNTSWKSSSSPCDHLAAAISVDSPLFNIVHRMAQLQNLKSGRVPHIHTV